jgi:hypothetical protein
MGGPSLELELIVVRSYLTVETLLCKQTIVSWPTTLIPVRCALLVANTDREGWPLRLRVEF